MKFYVVFSLAFIATLSPLFGQLTPVRYRAEVVANSWDLKSVENSILQSAESEAYQRTHLLPKLSMSGSYRYFLRQNDAQKPWSIALEPQLIQTIYGGGVVRAKVDEAELMKAVAMCSAEFTLLEVGYVADFAYWNYWAMNRYYLVMERYVEIIVTQSAKIRRKYEEGYTAKGDLLMIESRLSEAEYELIAADKRRMEALYNMNILRGRAPEDSLSLSKVVIADIIEPRRMTMEQVLDQRPDYRAYLIKEEVAKVATRGVKGGYNPTLQAGVVGGVRSYLSNIDGDTYLDGSLYLSLSVPIYRFGERRRAVAVSQGSERQSEIDSAMLLESIVKDESNAWLAVVDSGEQIDVMKRSLDIASENLEISIYSYNEGLVSIVDLLQAQISWMQIYTNAITSEYNYLVAVSYYKKTVGLVEY